MKKAGILAILLLCSLTGCQAVPEEVKEAKERYQENKQINETDISYTNLSGVKESVKEALQLKPDNLILPEHIDFSAIKEVNTMIAEFNSGFIKEKDEFAKIFGYDKQEWKNTSIERYGYQTYTVENEEEQYDLGISDNGFASAGFSGVYKEFFEQDTTELTHIYHIERSEAAEDVCTMEGEETTVQAQVDYINQWFDEKWKWKAEGISYQVKTAMLRKMTNGNDMISICMEGMYGGIPFDTYGGEMKIDTKTNTAKMIHVGTQFIVAQTQKERIEFFTTSRGTFHIASKEEQKELLDLPSAIHLVEKEISGFQKLAIADIRIIYMLAPIYEEGQDTFNHDAPGRQMEVQPYYRFYINRNYQDMGFANIENGSLDYFINVDMLTGKISLNLGMDAYKSQGE